MKRRGRDSYPQFVELVSRWREPAGGGELAVASSEAKSGRSVAKKMNHPGWRPLAGRLLLKLMVC
jgi:hypothetical protein